MKKAAQVIDSFIKDPTVFNWKWVPLSRPLSMDIYKQWIEDGYHGLMNYLAQHIPEKEFPEKLLPKAQSAFVFTHNYFPVHDSTTKTDLPLTQSRIATYAQGADYHHWFKKKLGSIQKELEKTFPNEAFVSFVDSSPVLERDLAYRSGLGWVGKNTCLIDRKRGSLFFIGEIYSTLSLETHVQLEVSPDHCGSCTRCLDACPTGALIAPKKMDATRCISYLTIESKEIPPTELRKSMGDWLFGCDICQSVCPWNEKVFGRESMKAITQGPNSGGAGMGGPDVNGVDVNEDDIKWSLQKKAALLEDLSFILGSSNKKLIQSFKETALSRAAGNKLKRNALIVVANLQLSELRPLVLEYVDHPYLGELAHWSLKQLENERDTLFS